MGGSHSSQSFSDTTNVFESAMQQQMSGCDQGVSESNNDIISGSADASISNVNQSITSTNNSKCISQLTANSSDGSNISSQIVQAIKQQQVAFTGFLDDAHSDISTALNQNITQSTIQSAVNKCSASFKTSNSAEILNSGGSKITGGSQTITATDVSSCVLSNSDVSQNAADITNAINQHSVYKSKNPLAFIADAIESTISSAVKTAAIVFVVIVIFIVITVIVFKVMDKKSSSAPKRTVFRGPDSVKATY